MTQTNHHIAWFRQTGPYIKAHRGRTFVIYLGNGAIESPGLVTLLHDSWRCSTRSAFDWFWYTPPERQSTPLCHQSAIPYFIMVFASLTIARWRSPAKLRAGTG